MFEGLSAGSASERTLSASVVVDSKSTSQAGSMEPGQIASGGVRRCCRWGRLRCVSATNGRARAPRTSSLPGGSRLNSGSLCAGAALPLKHHRRQRRGPPDLTTSFQTVSTRWNTFSQVNAATRSPTSAGEGLGLAKLVFKARARRSTNCGRSSERGRSTSRRGNRTSFNVSPKTGASSSTTPGNSLLTRRAPHAKASMSTSGRPSKKEGRTNVWQRRMSLPNCFWSTRP